jgi:hypothetical protein
MAQKRAAHQLLPGNGTAARSARSAIASKGRVVCVITKAIIRTELMEPSWERVGRWRAATLSLLPQAMKAQSHASLGLQRGDSSL